MSIDPDTLSIGTDLISTDDNGTTVTDDNEDNTPAELHPLKRKLHRKNLAALEFVCQNELPVWPPPKPPHFVGRWRMTKAICVQALIEWVSSFRLAYLFVFSQRDPASGKTVEIS
jgi:hypothetical protein